MIKAVNACLISKMANTFSGTYKMLYQKIYSAAACGHDCVRVLLEGDEARFIEGVLRERGYTTEVVSGLPSNGYVMLDIGWKF